MPPGQSVTVPVTLNSSKVAQPGTYTAGLTVGADTPQQVAPVTITLTANPPKTWGEITGTVTGASIGQPIAGATIQIGTHGGAGKTSYTTTTDSSGHYQWWLDAADDPLLVSAAKDGYQPQAHAASVSAGQATALNFALNAEPQPSGRQTMTMTGKHPPCAPVRRAGGGRGHARGGWPARGSARAARTGRHRGEHGPGSRTPARSGRSRGHGRAGRAPRLTADANAPCNTRVRQGFARCLAVIRTPADHQIVADRSGPPSAALGPADIQSAYKLPPGGQGQTVAIVDAYGDPNAAADLAAFRAYYGLPACTAATGASGRSTRQAAPPSRPATPRGVWRPH